MRVSIIILSIFAFQICLQSCGTTATKGAIWIAPVDKSKLYLQFPDERDFTFLGAVKVDLENQNGNNMVYPAYGGVAGFLAGIATHAAIQSGISSAKEKRKAELANQVIEKYQGILDDINAKSVVDTNLTIEVNSRAVEIFLVGEKVGDANILLAKVRPTFYLTQDESSLILMNEIIFSESERPEVKSSPVIVQYISSQNSSDGYHEYWQADEYSNFKRAIHHSFVTSVELGMKSYLGEINLKGLKQKTIRYLEGGKKKIERGYVIKSTCDRIVFQTLRGAIKSVPVHSMSGELGSPSQCA